MDENNNKNLLPVNNKNIYSSDIPPVPTINSADATQSQIPTEQTPSSVVSSQEIVDTTDHTDLVSDLFRENEEAVVEQTETKNRVSGKTIIIILVVFFALAFATYSVVQILLDKKFSSIYIDQNQNFGSDFSLVDDTSTQTIPVVCEGGNPFVKILNPNGGEVLKPGDMMDFSWDVCGIKTDLLDVITIEYYDSVSKQKIGSFDLSCFGEVSTENKKLSWTVPPYVEAGNVDECTYSNEIDFADDYLYKVFLGFAGFLYEDRSDDFFAIDISSYVYNPSQFSEYPTLTDLGFTRAFFIDQSAPQALKDVVPPSYFEAPPQFATYYRLYPLRCGTDCFVGVFLIDMRNGTVSSAPQFQNFFTKENSSLFIGEESITQLQDSKDKKVTWYEFDQVTKVFIILDTKLCDVVEELSERNYVGCVQP